MIRIKKKELKRSLKERKEEMQEEGTLDRYSHEFFRETELLKKNNNQISMEA